MKFPFNPKAGLVIVETKLFGPSGDFVVKLALDTGATCSLVNWHILSMLGYDPGNEKEQIEITTGSGIEYAPLLKLKKVQALGKSRNDFAFVCHTLPPSATVDGLLGLDFLRKRRLSLDFRKGALELG